MRVFGQKEEKADFGHPVRMFGIDVLFRESSPESKAHPDVTFCKNVAGRVLPSYGWYIALHGTLVVYRSIAHRMRTAEGGWPIPGGRIYPASQGLPPR